MALNINGTTGISGVDGSVSAPALTGTDSNTGITFPSADTIKFSTGGVERLSITNSGISGITAGITEMDNWRINTSFSASGINYLTSNWERNDTTFQKIGTGLTESSGVFSFPSTGKYLIIFFMSWTSANPSNYNGGYIRVTTDGTNYTRRADGFDDLQANAAHGAVTLFLVVDIENISTHKVRFEVEAQANNTLRGDSGRNVSGFISIKLGET
tara:strand:+ start:84 stop:725 length:642 start_codon:yes stop_codon:yes gene_type:complete